MVSPANNAAQGAQRATGAGHVCVWWIALDMPIPSPYRHVLSADEIARAERLVFEADRARFIAARTALRVLLSRELAVLPSDVGFTVGAHGKPSLASATSPQFNLSHSGDCAVVATSKSASVGIDLELMRSRAKPFELAREVFTPQEQCELQQCDSAEVTGTFLTGWTRKEACLKAMGTGLHQPPQQIEVGLRPKLAQMAYASLAAPDSTHVPIWVKTIHRDEICVVSLALEGVAPTVEFRQFDWALTW